MLVEKRGGRTEEGLRAREANEHRGTYHLLLEDFIVVVVAPIF